MSIRPRRSILYVPGDNGRALEKARALAADGFILDLEDAVAPDAKLLARQSVVAAVAERRYGARETIVRINDYNTPWGREDLAAAAAAGPDAILIPKVTCPGDIMHAAKDLREAGAPDHTALWAMMETPIAMLNADSILRTAADPASRLSVIVMGTNDIAKETRARLTPGRASIMTWLSTCVVAARAYSVEIIDGVYNDFSDAAGFRQECLQGRDLGMDGKSLIHPNQIATCNEIFAPPADEILWASKVISAFSAPENAEKGVLQVEGRMVERLHAEMARRTMQIAEAIAALA
ncbi:HpcH/HpaI aldolase/citrate lyase family protein [Beijerinckia indica]|uniref:Citryl-CoA lyase n=1 Tax=Beijerinckia indica subsp. indica (strain ATCC 9039 / DSM 1715 / NCIMB 8712) TaxID=395963 RepID=B2IJ67_BEII9|nr:CoA ester lyase [Beijerinckia indica]ACB94830.1 Citryl-CoA lyase [Beijerinckia indica subsp. indica ATCC 9039]